MFCAISGVAPEEPVFCPKTGYLYEKRLILKHLEQQGRDPITNEEISAADLVVAKSNAAIKPRPVSATSVSGMLHTLGSEWDALMLETFTLRQTLESTRQELSQALYQHDAACRVIARIVKERDQARAALSAAHATLAQRSAAGGAAASGDVEMSGSGSADSAAPQGVSAAALAAITDKYKELTKARRKRTVPPETAAPAAVSALGAAPPASFSPHSPSVPGGIVALAASALPAHAGGGVVLTGGADRSALLFSTAQGRVLARLEGHSKRVSAVAAHPSHPVLLTGSGDATVKLWTTAAGSDGAWALAATLRAHRGEVSGVSPHPLFPFAASVARDGTLAMHDLAEGRVLTVFSVADAAGDDSGYSSEAGFECGAWHPDGTLLGVGTAAGAVRMWDVRQQKFVHTFTGRDGGVVSSLSFNENGYFLATAGSDGAVQVLDLRKLSCLQSLRPEPEAATAAATAVAFDASGLFLAAGSSSGTVAVWGASDWSPLLHAPRWHGGAVTGVAWGAHAAALYTGSSDDKTIKAAGKLSA